MLLLVAAQSVASGADPTWERKLDPFLKRMAQGSSVTRDGVQSSLTARSRPVLLSLPKFVQVDHRGATPALYVKAAIERRYEMLEPLFREMGVELRARVGDIVSLRVPAESLQAQPVERLVVPLEPPLVLL